MRRTRDLVLQIMQRIAEVARNGLLNAPLIALFEISDNLGVFVGGFFHSARNVERVEDKTVCLEMQVVQYPDDPFVSGGMKDVGMELDVAFDVPQDIIFFDGTSSCYR